jgi:hypothetical protein
MVESFSESNANSDVAPGAMKSASRSARPRTDFVQNGTAAVKGAYNQPARLKRL